MAILLLMRFMRYMPKVVIREKSQSRIQRNTGILIRKVDVDGNGIEGVSFNIFRFGEDTPLPNSPVTTGDDGTARLDGLEPGHYQVQEVQAKPGYLLNSKSMTWL